MVNLWPNSSFETSTEPWVANAGSEDPVQSTERAYDGYISLYCRRGAGSSAAYARADLDVNGLTEAGTFTLSARVYIPSTAAGTNGLRVSGSGVLTTNLYTDVRDAWVEITGSFTWDGQGSAALDVYGSDPSAELWLDLLLIDDGTPPDEGGDEDDEDLEGGGATSEGEALLTFQGIDLLAEAPIHPGEEEWWFEASADEFEWGDPERAVTEIVSQLAEGSVVVFGETGNRTASFRVRATSPTSLGLTLAERSLIMACDAPGLKALTYAHPDGTSPATVFDVILADAAFEMDDLDELRCSRTWTLTLTCKPWPRSATPVVIEATNVPGEQPAEPPEDLTIEDGSVPSHFSMNQSSLSFNKIGQMIVKPTITEPTTRGRGTANGSSMTWSPPNEIRITTWNPGTPATWGRFTYGREVTLPNRLGLTGFQGTRKPYLYRNTNTTLTSRPFVIIYGFAATWSANYAKGVIRKQGNKKIYRYSGLGNGVIDRTPDLEFRIAGQKVKPVEVRRSTNGSFRAVLSGAGVRSAATIGFAVNITTNYDVTETFLAVNSMSLTAGKPSSVDGRMQGRSLPIPGSKPAEVSIALHGYTSAGAPASLGAETLIYSSTADDTEFQPPLTAYRAAGPLRTNDGSALSGAYNLMATGPPSRDTYALPAGLLTPGTYQILASVAADSSANAGIHEIGWQAAMTLANTEGWPYVNGSGTVDLVAGKWRIRSIGGITLPLLDAEMIPERMNVRLILWAKDEHVKLDTILLCNLTTGDLSLIDTSDNGALKAVGARVYAPSSQRPSPTTWIEYSDGSILQAGPRVIAPGVHRLLPPAAELFTITTGNEYSTLDAQFFPRWATYAVGSPADLDMDTGSGEPSEDIVPQGSASGSITWTGWGTGSSLRTGSTHAEITWEGAAATGNAPELPSFAATFNIGDQTLGTPMAATLYLGGITPGTVIDWGDGASVSISGSSVAARTHTYETPGVYQAQLFGAFDRIGSSNQFAGQMSPLISVDLWSPAAGTTGAGYAFRGANNLEAVVSPPPSLTNMNSMFRDNSAFNGDLSTWDVSSVTDMGYMFYAAAAFNGDLSTWDTSAVTNMPSMFSAAAAFNGDLSTWDTSAVTNMSSMFRSATVFSQDLSGWDVSNVTGHKYFETGSALTPEQLPHWID